MMKGALARSPGETLNSAKMNMFLCWRLLGALHWQNMYMHPKRDPVCVLCSSDSPSWVGGPPLLTPVLKNPPVNAGDSRSIPGSGREEEMAPHFSILTGTIPRAEEPGRLQSMGLQRVGHN